MVVVKISIVLLHAKIILSRKAKLYEKFHNWPNVESGEMVELKAEDWKYFLKSWKRQNCQYCDEAQVTTSLQDK